MSPLSSLPLYSRQFALVPFLIITLAVATSVVSKADSIGLFRGESYFQSDASAPTGDDLDSSLVMGIADAPGGDYIFGTILSSAGVIPIVLIGLDDTSSLFGELPFFTNDDMIQQFPNGANSFQFLSFSGTIEGSIPLNDAPLPPIPAINNYSDLQSLDPSQPFTLKWNAFTGATASDAIWVRAESDGEHVYSTPVPGAPGALAGSATQTTLPAGIFTENTDAVIHLSFHRITQSGTDATSGFATVSGATRRTYVEFTPNEGGGGGDPTGTPPTLIATSPTMGSLNIPQDTQVRFSFSKPMLPQEDVQWIQGAAPIDNNHFQYTWSADARTLTAVNTEGFAGGQLIAWTLGSGFKDAEGLSLQSGTAFGFFTTIGGGGTGDDCDDELFEHEGTLFISKIVSYNQTGIGTVSLASNNPVNLFANFAPPQGALPTAVRFTPPSRPQVVLSSILGSLFFHQSNFNTEAEFTTAYPNGSYTAVIELLDETPISLSATGFGPSSSTPTLANYTAAQSINPDADFTLQWNAFSGASSDSVITIDILDANGEEVFSAPDECEEIELDAGDTQITIPAGTLQPGQTYELEIGFRRFNDSTEHSETGITFMTVSSIVTKLAIRTTGGVEPADLVLTNPSINSEGRFEVTVQGTGGSTVILEAGTLSSGWIAIGTFNLPISGTLTVEDPQTESTDGVRLYRARQL